LIKRSKKSNDSERNQSMRSLEFRFIKTRLFQKLFRIQDKKNFQRKYLRGRAIKKLFLQYIHKRMMWEIWWIWTNIVLRLHDQNSNEKKSLQSPNERNLSKQRNTDPCLLKQTVKNLTLLLTLEREETKHVLSVIITEASKLSQAMILTRYQCFCQNKMKFENQFNLDHH